ncbi:MAG: N-acyl homoserine lactonase family protein [Oscillospiraceae bacterium]|nr:N-acyl homoserine lactonase family protein [Oscillospiraceae bacterium]
MKAYVLKNGTLIGPRKGIIDDCPDDPSITIATPIYCVLFEHPDGYILFDAACHDDAARQSPFILNALDMKEEEKLLNRLAEINVKPEDIKYVILSHMHADHSGYIEKFPNAEIYVSDREFRNTVKDYALGVSRSGPDVEYWISCKLNWKLIPDEEKTLELAEGITILNLGSGHSYGMLGLLAQLPKTGKILIVGDAIYTSENLGPPVKLPGIIQDPVGYQTTVDYVTDLAKKENAQIWFGHDIEQYKNFIASGDGCYE